MKGQSERISDDRYKIMTSNISISSVLIILGLAALIGAAVIILYRVKVNRALQGKESGAHIGVPAPSDTLSGLFRIVILILLIVICINLGKLNTLLQEIENVRDNVQNNNSFITSEIGSLKADLAEINSRVYSYESDCTGIDVSDNTCTVRHTVRLKTFSDATEVFLTAGDDSEIKMTNTGLGRFEAELTAGLFSEMYYDPFITITENGTSSVETLSAYSDEAYYWQMYIPSLSAQAGTGIELQEKVCRIGTISAFSEYKHDYHIASARITVEKNGSEIDSMDVLSSFDVPFGFIEMPVNKEYPKTAEDKINVRLILATEDGYTMNLLLFSEEDGRHISYGNNFTITDRNGKQVY